MLIGLCGKPTSGKSEVAQILIRDYGFQLLDTKEILKKITSDITGVPFSVLNTTAGKEQKYMGRENRFIMGEIGHTLEALFGSEYLMKRALQGRDYGKDYVLDSLRQTQPMFFPGEVVEVINTRVADGVYDFDEYDKSEIKFTVDNSGTLSHLEGEVQRLLESIRK